MFEKLKEAFSQFTFLGPKDLLQLAAISKLRTYKKNEHFLREGDMNYNIAIVVKGLFRHYVIDENGVDKTLLFVPEKNYTTSVDTIFRNRPATENIEALENSIVIKTDEREFNRIASGNARLLKLQNQSLKQAIIGDVEHIKMLNLLTAEERYFYFCETHPNLQQRIKQKYLASFLGMTPTSLSRLRARVTQS